RQWRPNHPKPLASEGVAPDLVIEELVRLGHRWLAACRSSRRLVGCYLGSKCGALRLRARGGYRRGSGWRLAEGDSWTCAYRKSHPTFRRLHLQDLHPDTSHRLSNLYFAISLLVYGSLPSSLFPCWLLFCASP